MTITLAVTKRDETTKTDALRVSGLIPAVVYGPKQAPVTVTIEEKVFDKVLSEAGESTIIELAGLENKVEVLIKDVDFNPVKQRVMHVDFYAIEKGKEMTTQVALHFIGEAPVEQAKLGTVTKVLHEVEVTCLPTDLPAHIDVNLDILAEVDDKILVKDLVVPKGVKIDAEADDAVAVVKESKEELESEESGSVDMSSVEVEQKGKTEAEAE